MTRPHLSQVGIHAVDGRQRKHLLTALGLLLIFVIARAAVAAPGDLDPSFDGDGMVTTPVTQFNDRAFSVEIQTDGKIVVGGYFSTGQTADYIVARYNANGSLDPTFDGDGIAIISIGDFDSGRSMTLQPDGKILVTGVIFAPAASGWMLGLARLNTDGSFDTTFDGDGKVTTLIGNYFSVNGLAVQTDGKVVVAGGASPVSGAEYNTFIYRYNSDGSLDSTFDGDGKVSVQVGPFEDLARTVAIQPDGKIVTAGWCTVSLTPNNFQDDFAVIRLNSDGSLDTTFDGDGTAISPIGPNLDRALGMAFQTDGKIVLTGFTQDLSFNWDVATVRYNPNGSLDTSFDSDGKLVTPIGAGDDIATSIRIQNDNKIVVAGRSHNGSNNDFAVIRFNSDGSLDTTFSGDGKVVTPIGIENDEAQALAIQSDGKLVVAGLSRIGATDDFSLGRYLGEQTINRRSPFDFDGDGKTDPSVYRPSMGDWYLLNTATGFRAVHFGLPSDIMVPADYTGDGKTDMAVWRPSDSIWYVLRSEDNTFYGAGFGASGDIPAPGDYDGDGKADLVVIRPGAQQSYWYLQQSTAGFAVVPFGLAGDVPTIGDYDGDGKNDVAVYRPSAGAWFRFNSSNGSFLGVGFGISEDKVVPADYTGDGKTDLAVFRPSNNIWFILRSEDNSLTGGAFGAAGDLPSPGDYDGDGKADLAVYRLGATPGAQSIFYVLQTTAGFNTIPWGLGEDRPVPGAYVY